jgi:malate dehydrogenase (oxaloacetate-decarboxylating)
MNTVKKMRGIRVINVVDRTFTDHIGGKIEICIKIHIKNLDGLAMVYTPGVARVSQAIDENPDPVRKNTVSP